MIDFNMDMEHAILTVCPQSALSEQDFSRMTTEVDRVIAQQGELAGLIIHAKAFPGWDSFSGMLSHFHFIHDHHRHIKKVAVVSDSSVLSIFPHISAHFVSAELRHFHYEDYHEAVAWIQAGAEET